MPVEGWLPSALTSERIPTHVRSMKGMPSVRNLLWLAKRARRNKLQVIHTHLTRAAYFGHMLGLVTRLPVITSVHIANNDQIYKRIAKRRNRLVAVSNFVCGMLHGQGIPDRYVATIYNGTDFLEYPESDPFGVHDELGISREKRFVGLVAKVCRDKGHLELVEAMRSVRQEHPNTHMLFVGRIEEEFRPELDEAIREAKIGDSVTFTGVRHDIPRMLDSLTLCTLPSRMETFGVAAIEAMARGRAVVATRVGALPEVVEHGQSGLLVDLRPTEIAEAVSYLLANDDIRADMGRMGRHIVEEKFSLREMVRRFEDVYENAVTA